MEPKSHYMFGETIFHTLEHWNNIGTKIYMFACCVKCKKLITKEFFFYDHTNHGIKFKSLH
jgi:hypothetical protein